MVLPLVMAMVTVSAGTKDFADAGDITCEEAVAVISTIGVVNGCEDGGFKPTDGLSRPGEGLSGDAFMKMLLDTLGCGSKTKGFTGPNWTIGGAKLVKGIGLDQANPELTGSTRVNRKEACLYSFKEPLINHTVQSGYRFSKRKGRNPSPNFPFQQPVPLKRTD